MHSPLKPASNALAALALTGLALTSAPARAGGLNGQPVQVTYRQPDTSTITTDDGTHTITSSGATFLDPFGPGPDPFMTIVVTPSKIEFTPTNQSPDTGIGFPNGSFRGYDVAEVGQSPVNILGVSIDPMTSISSVMTGPETFDMSRVTFDSGSVFVNFQGLQMTAGDNVTLDLKPAPVPEASTTVSFGLLLFLGMGGLIIAAKRRKAGAVV